MILEPSQLQGCGLQVLGSTLPVGLTRVDCDGDESSLLQCTSVSSHAEITFQRNNFDNLAKCATLNSLGNVTTTDSTILACGSTAAGAHWMSWQADDDTALLPRHLLVRAQCTLLHTYRADVALN